MLTFEGMAVFELVVQSQGSTAGSIKIVGTTREGPFVLTHTPSVDRGLTTEKFRLPDFPILISVIDKGELYKRGECYVRVNVAINGDIVQQIAAGYVYQQVGLTWPITNIQEPMPPVGLLYTFNGTNPGVGNEIQESVPDNALWKINSVRFLLSAAAVAVNRVVHLIFQVDATTKFDCISNTAQTSGQAINYSCFPNLVGGSSANDDDIIIPIPQGILLPALSTIITETTALDVNDNFTGIEISVEEFLAAP